MATTHPSGHFMDTTRLAAIEQSFMKLTSPMQSNALLSPQPSSCRKHARRQKARLVAPSMKSEYPRGQLQPVNGLVQSGQLFGHHLCVQLCDLT